MLAAVLVLAFVSTRMQASWRGLGEGENSWSAVNLTGKERLKKLQFLVQKENRDLSVSI